MKYTTFFLKVVICILFIFSLISFNSLLSLPIENYSVVYAQGEGDDDSADPPPDIYEDDEDFFFDEDDDFYNDDFYNDDFEDPYYDSGNDLPDTPINTTNFLLFLGTAFIFLAVAVYITGNYKTKEEKLIDKLSK